MRRTTMHLTSAAVLTACTALLGLASACGGSDSPPATAPTATAYPAQPTGYPQQGYPQQGYPQQPAYPQQQSTAYPQPTGVPQTQPTAAAAMATPGPLALPCQNDSACGLHKCNTQFQKCAFPCQTVADCGAGNQCMMGICAPKAPGSP